MRKASFRDKYIEVCESMLQDPNGVVIKGALLSHLKLNVSPIVGCGKEGNGNTTTTNNNNNNKSKSIKCLKGESPLRRKRCLRNCDVRTRAEKARGIAVYEERICGEDNDNNNNNNNNIDNNKLELLSTTIRKEYLIPDDIKKQILIANGLETRVSARDDSIVRRTKPIEQLADENGNNIGTYLTIAYRNNNNNKKRTSTSASTDSNTEKKIHHQYVKVERLKRVSSVSEAGEEEEGNESPYSTARDLEEKLDTLPKYYIIDDETCEHGLIFPDCFQCYQGDDPIYSEPSSSCGDSDSYNESSCQEQLPPEWLPGQYLKQTVVQQSSNGSGVSTDDIVDGGEDRIYYCLEEMHDEVEENYKWQKGMGKLQNQPKLCDIEETEESDEDEIFV